MGEPFLDYFVALSLLVRTWNLCHGRTVPPSGRIQLERMVRLVTGDGPHVVGLQEVPVWALSRLEAWSGMLSVGAVARPARLGALGRRLTAVAPDLFRSAFNGQANALLVGRPLAPVGERRAVELERHGARERRVCQLVPVGTGGRRALVANLHATAHAPAIARRQLEQVSRLVAGSEEATIVVGDFNVRRTGLPGFSPPIEGIDQILVRGLDVERPPRVWSAGRRRSNGRLLSDHAPVEAVVAWT
jgi:endonuclease/exonuclease/phosphatase family metal-dependent hydrolase